MRQTDRRVVRAAVIGVLLVAAAATRPHGTAAQMPALRWDGLVEHLTVAASAPQPSGPSRLSRHAVTRDGRYVVFDSDATNLGPWGEPSAIYRRDRATGYTERLFGMTGSDAVISADGLRMAFVHCAGWFRPDMAAICDIYVVDLRNWSVLVASSFDGTYSDGPSSQPVLSGDGRFVLFRSTAPNLIPAGFAGGAPYHRISSMQGCLGAHHQLCDTPLGRARAESLFTTRPTLRFRTRSRRSRA